jgi:hypothetical protein
MTTHELSLQWLERAREAVNADPSFRKRGSIDATMAVRVDDAIFLVTFGGFSCHEVRTITAHDLRDADFVVDMSNDQWNRFLAGRRGGDGRTLVEIDTTDGVIKAQNPHKQLDFLRYHTSIQAFFDAGCATRAA